MIVIGDTILSDDIIEKDFVCDLNKCKGACCEQGDLGAPLEDNEKAELEGALEVVKPYLSPEGLKAIEEQGAFIRDYEGDFSTPLIGDSGACAYAIKDENQMWKCGIELAWKAGKTDFRKPVSCHLYPARIKEYGAYYAINYDRWDICSAACTLGEKLKVPVYKFLKEALIRRFGQGWYNELERYAEDKNNAAI